MLLLPKTFYYIIVKILSFCVHAKGAFSHARTHTNKYERSDPYCSKDFNCQTTLPIIITKRIMKKKLPYDVIITHIS